MGTPFSASSNDLTATPSNVSLGIPNHKRDFWVIPEALAKLSPMKLTSLSSILSASRRLKQSDKR
jgi:hypothetical protein